MSLVRKKFAVKYLQKSAFVEKIYQITESVFTRAEARVAYDAFMAVFVSEIEQGNPVYLPQFGKFYFAARKEKIGKNPHTGEEIVIPARLSIRLRVIPSMRKELNKAKIPEHLIAKKDLTTTTDCSIEVKTIQVDTTQSI